MTDLPTNKLFADCTEKLDKQMLVDYYENDVEYALNMFETFNELMPSELVMLEDAYRAKDVTQLGRIAHKIKSSFSLVGLTDLYHIAAELDSTSRDVEDIQVVEDLYIRLIQQIQEMKPIVEEETQRLRNLMTRAY